ncbi:MAG: hypothetical protein IPI32_05705 [Austwickia sp.]|nr:hypothetical protein [Austwickia sp.]
MSSAGRSRASGGSPRRCCANGIGSPTRSVARWWQTIEADADHLSRLLLELMDVARLGTSRLPLHESVFDLQELARGSS